ncbi:MAG: GNAT family N-acetyltransferase [Gemmatimonadota bacterium]
MPQDFRAGERGEIEDFLRDLPGPYWVLEDEAGRIVGCGGYAVEADGRTATLCWGMVVRARQGEGLGRALLEHRIRAARADPAIDRIALHTSHRARGFFERLGFRATRVTPDGIAPGLDAVDMERGVGRG